MMKKVIVVMLVVLSAANLYAGFPEKKLMKKLHSIRIKHIEYDNAAIDDVIKVLSKQVKQLDPSGKGINMIVAVGEGKNPKDYKVTLNLSNLPLYHALNYISKSANMQFFLRENTVVVADKKIARSGMEIRTYKVKPHTVSTLKRMSPNAKIKDKEGKNDFEAFGDNKEDIFE